MSQQFCMYKGQFLEGLPSIMMYGPNDFGTEDGLGERRTTIQVLDPKVEIRWANISGIQILDAFLYPPSDQLLPKLSSRWWTKLSWQKPTSPWQASGSYNQLLNLKVFPEQTCFVMDSVLEYSEHLESLRQPTPPSCPSCSCPTCSPKTSKLSVCHVFFPTSSYSSKY